METQDQNCTFYCFLIYGPMEFFLNTVSKIISGLEWAHGTIKKLFANWSLHLLANTAACTVLIHLVVEGSMT